MQTIIEFFSDIYNWVISIFSEVYQYLLDLISSSIDSLFDNVLSLVPNLQPMWSYLEVVQPYTAFVNQWIALDTASTLLVSYFGFITTMISVKLFVKLFIPTVG